jgi:hypothetical protein
MRKLITVAVVAFLVGPSLAEVGEVAPVSVRVHHSTFSRPLLTHEFAKCAEGDGTVNEHAIIATMRGPDGMVVKAAIDSGKPDAEQADVIRFDFTGKGTFQDAPLVAIRIQGSGSDMSYARFGPVTLVSRTDGRELPVSVEGYYHKRARSRYMYVHATTALEGECRFGDIIRRVRLVDLNSNLRCNDKTRLDSPGQLSLGDTVLVADEEGSFHPSGLGSFYGQRLQVAGDWFAVTLSEDSTRISAEAVVVETGRIRVPHEQWSAMLLGREHLLRVSGGAEPIVVPADSYAVVDYKEQPIGQTRAMLLCAGREALAGRGKRFEVRPDAVTELTIGSPLTARLEIAKYGRDQRRFSLKLTDAAGCSVGNLTNTSGQRPGPPTLEVRDSSGEVVHSGKMEYG